MACKLQMPVVMGSQHCFYVIDMMQAFASIDQQVNKNTQLAELPAIIMYCRHQRL